MHMLLLSLTPLNAICFIWIYAYMCMHIYLYIDLIYSYYTDSQALVGSQRPRDAKSRDQLQRAVYMQDVLRSRPVPITVIWLFDGGY